MYIYNLNKEELDIIINLLIRELKESGAFSIFKRKWNSHDKVRDEIIKRHVFFNAVMDLLWSACRETYKCKYKKGNNNSKVCLLSSFAVIRFLFLLMENKSLYHLKCIELVEFINHELNYICYDLFPDMKINRHYVTLSELKNICGDDIINDFRELYINIEPFIIAQNKINCLE